MSSGTTARPRRSPPRRRRAARPARPLASRCRWRCSCAALTPIAHLEYCVPEMEHGTPARRSAPSARVTAVLGALADAAPTQRSLAEVARATSLSASTCLGILNELAAGDWVVRHRPGPTYSL